MATDFLEKKKETVSQFLMQPNRQKQLQAVLPKVGITRDRMIKLVFSALNQTPKLLECTPMSLYNSMIQSASLGLEPNTPLGHAYLVPFKGKAQLIIGYKGYIALAARTGSISKISSHIVREDDIFEYEYGTDEFLRHVPRGTGKPTHAYSIAWLKGGEPQFEVMTLVEIEEARSRSASANSGPWVTDWEMMARKTPIRKLFHYLPLSAEAARAVAIDERNEAEDEAGAMATIDIDGFEVEDEKKSVVVPDSLQGKAEKAQTEKPKQETKPPTEISTTPPPSKTESTPPQKPTEQPEPPKINGNGKSDEQIKVNGIKLITELLERHCRNEDGSINEVAIDDYLQMSLPDQEIVPCKTNLTEFSPQQLRTIYANIKKEIGK